MPVVQKSLEIALDHHLNGRLAEAEANLRNAPSAHDWLVQTLAQRAGALGLHAEARDSLEAISLMESNPLLLGGLEYGLAGRGLWASHAVEDPEGKGALPRHRKSHNGQLSSGDPLDCP